MYVGTGSTRGWEGWVKIGRHRHSMGAKDWQESQASSGLDSESGERSPTSADGWGPTGLSSASASGSEFGVREKAE